MTEAGSVREYLQKSLANWRGFVEALGRGEETLVLDGQNLHFNFDGQLFHVNVTNMLKQNGTAEQIASYIRAVAALTRPLKPKLVYFRHKI